MVRLRIWSSWCCYASGEAESAEIKGDFFELSQGTIGNVRGKLMTLGDLNGHVGNDSIKWEGAVGPHWDNILNVVERDPWNCLVLWSDRNTNFYTKVSTKLPEKYQLGMRNQISITPLKRGEVTLDGQDQLITTFDIDQNVQEVHEIECNVI